MGLDSSYKLLPCDLASLNLLSLICMVEMNDNIDFIFLGLGENT